MTIDFSSALHRYESLVKNGKIKTFTVCIQEDGACITPADSGSEQKISLEQELHTTLCSFFFGVKIIEYASFDYTTLKSLLNTHASLQRMLKQTNDNK